MKHSLVSWDNFSDKSSILSCGHLFFIFGKLHLLDVRDVTFMAQQINSLKPNDNSSLKPISIPFTGGHIGYERERVAQQGFILLFFDFFSYFQMSFLFITGLISMYE